MKPEMQFLSTDLMPQGQCYLWSPRMLWLHAGSDTAIALAFIVVSSILAYLFVKRPEVPHHQVYALVGVLLCAAGVTHMAGVWTVWQPQYVIEGMLKLLTSAMAIVTTFWLGVLLSRRSDAAAAVAQRAVADSAIGNQAEAGEQAAQALQSCKQRFRAIFDSIHVFISLITPSGTVLEVNRAMLVFAGVKAEDAVGKPFWECPWWAREAPAEQRLQAAIRRAAGGEFVRYRATMLDNNRQPATIDVSISPVEDSAGNTVLLVAEGHDITELRQAENQARQRLNQLAHLSRLDTMGEMATGLAHELNQPLTAIASNCEVALALLSAGPHHRDKLAKRLEQIDAQALRAGDIIKRLRSFVRRDDGERHPADLNAIIRDTVRLTAAEAQERRAQIKLALTEPLPASAVDQIQIEQVLVNLIRNSLEAIASADSDRREITIATSYHGDSALQVTVADTGCGLTQADLKQIFTPFYTNKAQGMGMGLPISRSIIETHGGRLWAEVTDSGARFSFTLPASKEQRHAK